MTHRHVLQANLIEAIPQVRVLPSKWLQFVLNGKKNLTTTACYTWRDEETKAGQKLGWQDLLTAINKMWQAEDFPVFERGNAKNQTKPKQYLAYIFDAAVY